MHWNVFAAVGAVAAGATGFLANMGMSGILSNLAVAIRTLVVLVFASSIVAARGEFAALRDVRGG